MSLFSDIRFKLASGSERDQAIMMRGEIYEKELGHHGVDDFDTTAYQLIAMDKNGEILAATRILDPNCRPFEIEKFVALDTIAGPNRVITQIGGLWIRSAERRIQSRALLPLGMLKLAFLFARRRGITDFVMRTHITALRRFYERGFFREVKHLAFTHPIWGQVYVMHLDLLNLSEHHKAQHDPIARFLLSDVPMDAYADV